MTKQNFGHYTFESSNEDKVLFPDCAVTKGDLIDHYRALADHILTHTRDRPVTMHRFPDGIDSAGFYHKQTPDHFPDWIPRADLDKKEGGTIQHPVCNNAATLAYLADQACITPHVWLARHDHPHQPDRLVIDLDPSDDDFDKVRRAARLAADAFTDDGLTPFLQLTGSSGIHVVAPVRRGPSFDDTRLYARDLCRRLADKHPDLLTTAQRKDKRADRVFLDTARNAYAQTMVTPYAVRARPGAPVATPIREHELDDPDIHPRRYNTRNIRQRLAQTDDPWKDIASAAADLQPLIDNAREHADA